MGQLTPRWQRPGLETSIGDHERRIGILERQPNCCIPPFGDDVADLILVLGPDAFWKLNETTGSVAADSSGNDHDLQPAIGFGPPTWEQEVAPTSDTSALFVNNSDALNDNADVAMGAFTNNFTAGIWAKFSVLSSVQEVIGQGQAAIHSVGGQHGWALAMNGDLVAAFADQTVFYGNNSLDVDTWYFLALVRDAGTWKLYVNGIVQSATSSTGISTGSTATWIANDGFGGHSFYLNNGLLSYGFMVDHVVSGTDLLELYNAGLAGGMIPAGWVWTTDGSGGASWQPQTIEVDY